MAVTFLTNEDKTELLKLIEAIGNGTNGKDGVSPVVSVEEIAGGHRITITDAEGAKTFDVMDGADGATGPQGQQGEQGIKGEKGDTGANGPAGEDGYTPVKGTDYYTAEEKTQMIADVTAGLAKITLVGTDEDDVQHTWTLYGVAN